MKQQPKILDVTFVSGAMSASQYPSDKIPEIAFAGKSNVGKSSLLRHLLNRKKLVRVSKTPGRTREINFFKVSTKDYGDFFFTDLPGYGYAKVSSHLQEKWGEIVTEYLEKRTNLKLVILLVDSRRTISEEETSFLEWMKKKHIRYVVVITKIDKIPKNQREKIKSNYKKQLPKNSDVFLFSSLTSIGVSDLWNAIIKITF